MKAKKGVRIDLTIALGNGIDKAGKQIENYR